MLNTLYTIAGGIALAVGALGASDDFDGAKLAQNAFFAPEDEIEAIDEQEATTEEVLAVQDIEEWNETAAQVMSMSLASKDELTDDEKLEIAVLTGEMPADDSENLEEVSQIAENSQPEGLSEEEFYCMLEKQYNDAIEALNSEEQIAENPIDEVNQEELANVQLQPEDDVNAEKALEEAVANSEVKTEDVAQAEQETQVLEVSEEVFKEEEPWVVVHGLPDIPDEDMNALMEQKTNVEQAENDEQSDIENVNVNEIPVVDPNFFDVPDVEAPELEDIEAPLFGDAEETEEAEAEETEVEEAETEKAEEAEAEEAEAEESKAEEVEAEEVEAEEADALIVEPLDADVVEADENEDSLSIPSIEIPPAVVSEQERAKISAEVDALLDQNESYDSWIPRQIPVSGSVDDVQTAPKPEESFIQEFSRKNAKESILENNGIDLNE